MVSLREYVWLGHSSHHSLEIRIQLCPVAEKFLRNFSMIPADLLHCALNDIHHGNIELDFCYAGRPGVHKALALGQAANEKATMVHGTSLLAPVKGDLQL